MLIIIMIFFFVLVFFLYIFDFKRNSGVTLLFFTPPKCSVSFAHCAFCFCLLFCKENMNPVISRWCMSSRSFSSRPGRHVRLPQRVQTAASEDLYSALITDNGEHGGVSTYFVRRFHVEHCVKVVGKYTLKKRSEAENLK